MKKLITTTVTALALFLFTGVHAEEMMLDSIHAFEWDGSGWEVSEKTFFTYDNDILITEKNVEDDEIEFVTYDADSNIVEETIMELEDTLWVYTEKMLYVYEDGQLLEAIEQEFDSVWINVEKRIKTYDAYGNLDSWYDKVWDVTIGDWIIEEGEVMTTEEFDANGQEIGKNEQTYTNGAWMDTKVYTYILNTSGLVIEVQAKEWEDSVWVNATANSLYEYDAEGNLTTMIWNKAASDTVIGDYSVKYRKWDYEYDSLGNVILELQYRNTTDDGEYKTYYKYTYAYDANGNMIFKVKDKYTSDYTDFAYYRKYIYEYSEANNKIYSREFRVNDDKDGYDDYTVYTYGYDEYGVNIFSRNDDFEDGEWLASREYDYTVDDSTGFVAEIQARDWDDSVWVNTSANALYEYDMAGNVTTELWNKSSDTSELGEYEVLYYKWDRTFDADNNLLSEERFKGNSSNDGYDIYRYNEYQYDAVGNETYELQKRVSGDAYYGYNEYIQSYDANSNMIEKIWNNKKTDKSGFKTYRKYIYEYNEAGQETLYLYTRANDVDSLLYDNYERELTTYSAEGYMTSVRSEEWDDSVWVIDEETVYELTLNSDDLITMSIEKETSDDITFEFVEKVMNYYTDSLLDSTCYYEYDTAWVLVEKDFYSYDGTTLVCVVEDELDERVTTSYDAAGNKLSVMEEEYALESWTMLEKRIYEYDSEGNQLMYTDKVYDAEYGWMYESGVEVRVYVYNAAGVKVDETRSTWIPGYPELDEEVSAEKEEVTEGDVFSRSYTFSVTEDDETYEFEDKEVYFYSEHTAASVNEATASAFGYLYPNPASDVVFLPQGDYDFAVFSVEGQKMLQGSRANIESIAVSSMAKGVYLIQYEGNNVSQTERFIVR